MADNLQASIIEAVTDADAGLTLDDLFYRFGEVYPRPVLHTEIRRLLESKTLATEGIKGGQIYTALRVTPRNKALRRAIRKPFMQMQTITPEIEEMIGREMRIAAVEDMAVRCNRGVESIDAVARVAGLHRSVVAARMTRGASLLEAVLPRVEV